MSTSGAKKNKKAPSPPLQKSFTAFNYYTLSEDRLNRFKPSFEPYIAYALVSQNSKGEHIAHQFTFPIVDSPLYPKVKKLGKISFGYSANDDNPICAITDDGCPMTTQRKLTIKVRSSPHDFVHYDLFFFTTPSASTTRQNLSLGNDHFEAYFANDSTQRGGELEIKYSNILARQNYQDKSYGQSKIMGCSAKEAYEDFYYSTQDILSNELKRILWKSIQAGDPYCANPSMGAFKRPEWCHALAKQFHRLGSNPQHEDNLGAAPLWLNSQMMIIENALKWHAKTYPDAKITLSSYFNMFGDTDVIQDGKMEGVIKRAKTTVKIEQYLLPHQIFPAYPQITDIALTTFVINNLLHQVEPETILITNQLFTGASSSNHIDLTTVVHDRSNEDQEKLLDEICMSMDLDALTTQKPVSHQFGIDHLEDKLLDEICMSMDLDALTTQKPCSPQFGIGKLEDKLLDEACLSIDLDAIVASRKNLINPHTNPKRKLTENDTQPELAKRQKSLFN